MNANDAILEAQTMGRRAGGRWLLRDVSLALHGGDRLGVVGTTGSGKTLLLRCLALLDEIQEGEIRFRNAAVSHHEIPQFRRQVIYLHQRSPLMEGTVEENLRRPLKLKIHRSRSFDREKTLGILQSLGRDASFLDQPARNLSGGEAQIVALLRAVQLEPAVLLLDEPTSALDAASTGAVEKLVDRWHGEAPTQRAVIWVSHDVKQIERVARQRLSMHEGRLDQTIPPAPAQPEGADGK